MNQNLRHELKYLDGELARGQLSWTSLCQNPNPILAALVAALNSMPIERTRAKVRHDTALRLISSRSVAYEKYVPVCHEKENDWKD